MATNINVLVKTYFSLGMNHSEILQSLKHFHGMVISIRTLRRYLKSAQLYRRKQYSDILDVAIFLMGLMSNSNSLHGYKFLHLKCIQNGLVVTQETVRLLLQIIDSEGVDLRKRNKIKRRVYSSKGPNFCWHIDSYDKLKPYGICINGAIDGYSRLVLWLKAFRTNSDPKVIAHYFTEVVKKKNGCPSRIRVDMGTENKHVCQMQKALRWDHSDDHAKNSVIIGSSVHNQRIECWWGFLRLHLAQFWMNLFQDLKERDQFTGDFLDKNLIQFVFMRLIQQELEQVEKLWNCHQIRAKKNSTAPHGKPIALHNWPHLYGSRDFLYPVTANQVQVCQEHCRVPGPAPCDETVFELGCSIMEEKGWVPPDGPEEGITLYEQLRAEIINNL